MALQIDHIAIPRRPEYWLAGSARISQLGGKRKNKDMTITTRLGLSLIAALMLTGCSAGVPQPTESSRPTPSASSTPTPLPAGTPAPAPTTVPSVDPNALASQCADADLAVAIGPSDGAAGSLYREITFTNVGGVTCALQGSPAVSVVGEGNGTQIGAAAESTAASAPAAPPIVSLAPGGTAAAVLQSINIGDSGGPLDDACTVQTGDGYRILPPHSSTAVFVAAPQVPACSNGVVWLHVNAVAVG